MNTQPSFDVMMVNPEEKRPFVQHLFTSIAPRYDWFNRLASCGLDQRWRHRVMVRGAIEATHRVLDVCAGTGDLALLCARRQRGPRPAADERRGGQGTVIGIDMNREMLGRAQRKSRDASLAVQWVQGDAEALPFPTETFDRVTIGFSTRNLSDLDQGLAEMVRVLRPGGRLVILETGYPSNRVVRFGYRLFLSTVARLIGFLLTGRVWPFTYLAQSVRQFLTPPQVVERLQRANTRVEYVPLSWGLASLYVATKSDARDRPCATDVMELTCHP